MRESLWQPIYSNGSLYSFNPFTYLNALKDPDSEDSEADQMVTIKDFEKLLGTHGVVYDPRTLEYFFAFFEKSGFIRIEQIIAIFVPDSKLIEARSSSYSNFILDSLPFEKMQLVISILLAELVLAKNMFAEFNERMGKLKPSIIDVYFESQHSFKDRIFKLYASRTGEPALPLPMAAMATRLERCTTEPKLISNAFRFAGSVFAKTQASQSSLLGVSLMSQKDITNNDSTIRFNPPMYQGQVIDSAEVDHLPGILAPRQFISFDHRKQTSTDRLLLSAVINQPSHFGSFRQVDPSVSGIVSQQNIKDSSRIISNPKYDDRPTDLSYNDTFVQMDSFKVINKNEIEKQQDSPQNDFVPFHAQPSSKFIGFTPTVIQQESPSKNVKINSNLISKPIIGQSQAKPPSFKPYLEVEDAYGLNEHSVNSPSHRNKQSESVSVQKAQTSLNNSIRDSKHNIPMKTPQSSKVFVSRASLMNPVLGTKTANAPSTKVSRPASPIRKNASPSPSRKSITQTSTRNVLPMKRSSVITPINNADAKKLAKSPSVKPRKSVSGVLPNDKPNLSTVNKSFTSTASKTIPVKSQTDITKAKSKTPVKSTKTPVLSQKTPVTVTSTRNPPKPIAKAPVEKTPVANKRNSIIKPPPSKSPVKPPIGSSKVVSKILGKPIASEKTSGPGIHKAPVPEKNVIEVHQKVVKEGSVVTSSTTFVRKETEPSNNLPLKISMGESKVGFKRGTCGPEDISKNLPNIDEEKRNNSLRSIDISAISNFDKRVQKNGRTQNENSVERQDYDTHMLLKNLEDFEKTYELGHRNRFQSMSMAPPTIEDVATKSNKEIKLPILTDHSLKNILKINAGNDLNNNSYFDDQMQHDAITPVNKTGKYTYDVEMRFTTHEQNKEMEKPMASSNLNINSLNGMQSPESQIPGFLASSKKNTTSIGMLLQPNTDLQAEDLTDKRNHNNLHDHYPKHLSTFSSGSYKIAREILGEIVKRTMDNIDDALVKFHSNVSNNDEMSQLLAKYTDTSFHQNFNKVYTHANLSSDNLNASFRKGSLTPNRETLDRSFNKPLTSTTMLFDHMHFNYLNNLTDTRTNFADTRTNFLRKTLNLQNEDIASPYPTDKSDNANRVFPQLETKPLETDNKKYEKFNSFTNSDNVFLNNEFNSRDPLKQKTEGSPTPNSKADASDISSGFKAFVHSNSLKTDDKRNNDVGNEVGMLTQSESGDRGKMYHQNSPQAHNKLLNNSSEECDQRFKSHLAFNRQNSGMSEENHYLQNLSEGESFAKKQMSWTQGFNSNGDVNLVNQEMDKSLKGSQYDFNKQMTLDNLKKDSNAMTKAHTFGEQQCESPIRNIRLSQQTSEEWSSSMLLSKVNRVTDSSVNYSTPLDSNDNQSGVRKSSKLQILDLTNEFSRINSKSDLIYKLTLLFKKILVYSSKIEAIKSELFGNNPNLNILEIFQLYDENTNGVINGDEFEAFIADVGIQVSEQQSAKILEYVNNVIWPEGNDTDKLSTLQFANMFIPSNTDNRFILKQMLEMKQKRPEGLGSAEADDQPIIHESHFLHIRQILIFIMRKIEDLSAIVQTLREYKIEEAFFAITKGEKKDITWKILSEFLEQNDVRFIDEDLVYIFRDFRSKSMGIIGYQNFSEFLNLKVWLI